MLRTGRLLAPHTRGLCHSASTHRSLRTPGISYRGPWRLPEPDSHRLVVLNFSLGYTTHSFLVAPELLDAQWFGKGQQFENITLIQLPPYAPDHNPTEHVWNHAKGAIANIQRETANHTFSAFESFVQNGTFKYDFEYLPIPRSEFDPV